MGEEANVSYAYLKAMQRKRKTGAEREGQITSRRKANLMHMQHNICILLSVHVCFMKQDGRTAHY
jgi:hypothetical protein